MSEHNPDTCSCTTHCVVLGFDEVDNAPSDNRVYHVGPDDVSKPRFLYANGKQVGLITETRADGATFIPTEEPA